MENQDKPTRKPRTPRKTVTPDISVIPDIVEPEATETDISEKSVETPAEPTLADKIRLLHEAAKATEIMQKLDIPREGDVVAMLDIQGNIVQTYTVRRRGTTMTEAGSNRTYTVPVGNLTKVAEKVWSFPQTTTRIDWDKIFKSDKS